MTGGYRFHADCDEEAKERLKSLFDATGHLSRCINSRPGYFQLQCTRCDVRCNVGKARKEEGTWEVKASTSEMVALPCAGRSSSTALTDATDPAIAAPTAAPTIVAPTAAPQLHCFGCVSDVSAIDGCACDAAGHFLCNECFSDMVTTQVTGVDKPAFLANGCVITCPDCQAAGLRTVFDMRLCAPHLTQAAYSAHLKTMAEPEVAREQEEWRRRLAEARLQGGGAAAVDESAGIVDDIAERLVAPTCPNCSRHIPDFDACAALQCGRHAGSVADSAGMGCGAHLCAWCLHDSVDADACHKHVMACCKNPSPGEPLNTKT